MRAAQVTEFGGPDKVALVEVADPTPAEGQVLIEVRAAGVNFAEILARQGHIPGARPPFVTGLEVAGVVLENPRGAPDLAPGTPVIAFTQAGYAEKAVADARLVCALPQDWTAGFEIAATLACSAVTAHMILADVARIRPHESVLVHAAAGGLGSMAAQIAKSLGASTVSGTVGNPDKIDTALALGYDRVLVRDDFEAALADSPVDIALESIGGDNLTRTLSVLAPGGRAVYFGDPYFDTPTTVDATTLRATNRSVQGFSLGRLVTVRPERWLPSARAVVDLAATGALTPTLDRVIDLADAAKAHARIESRQSVGKVVLTMQSDVPPA